jgi:putative ABC transport system ATP-binding protein
VRAPLLALRDVALTFRRGRRVVRVLGDASLEVRAGELMAVLAGRGQGKTSLLRVAAGMERPERGRVLFNGRDLWTLSDRRRSELLRHEIALAEPLGPDIDLPVLTHVAIPLFPYIGRQRAYERALRTLARMGLREVADEPWTGLADSERALVVLAQGIVRKPELLLIDNVTATLGIRETEALGRLLRLIAEEDGLAAFDVRLRRGRLHVVRSRGDAWGGTPGRACPEGSGRGGERGDRLSRSIVAARVVRCLRFATSQSSTGSATASRCAR